MHEVYSPWVSGFGSLEETRTHLLAKGMTEQFADLLAHKFIMNCELGNQKILTVMDFYRIEKIGILKPNFNQLVLNYLTLKDF